MRPLRIFLSSVQREFAQERAALRDYLRGDVLMRRFFEVFLFEEVPAADRPADALYLEEVDRCHVYLGLLGDEYGFEDAAGVSPTQREYERATAGHKVRLVFVKGADDGGKHSKMQALVRRVGVELIRRRFGTAAELLAAVYAALVQLLEERELIRTAPFDAVASPQATVADLDPERMAWFVRQARRARGFPLAAQATPQEVLAHLNLLAGGRPTNAAVLLFGRQPQRFLGSSEVKCAHFHGTEVAKPIPSYQVYKGTVFALVDQAVDFVMSKISLRVGTRAAGAQAPVTYEIPREVVAEAVVNAVAHRDYTSSGSVQVMLFADRLEVWNPGSLPQSITLAMLREPHGSVPVNPLLAEPLYLASYIERMGTGTGDMIRLCREAGLREPEFAQRDGFVLTLWRAGVTREGNAVQPESRPESQPESRPESLEQRVMGLLAGGARSKAEIAAGLGHKEISGQLNKVIRLLLQEQIVAYTIPEKPNSRLQKYVLTERGKASLEALRARRGPR